MPHREERPSKMVHIIDDEESVRRSLSFMLRRAGYDTSCWVNPKQFIEQLRNFGDGCILLDVQMPEVDGLEAQQALMDSGCAMPIIMMSGQGDIATAVRAIKAGALDFIEKPFDRETMLDLIGEVFARLDGAKQTSVIRDDAASRIARLTQREQQVLENLAQGLPNKAIAYDLGISARTVEVHRANLMMKLQVRSFPEALRLAFVAGLGA